MWYENSYRRHLCDMHIEDWDESFLSEFDPEAYYANLKKANVQNAMLYFQSHVGLCYYPTRSGKMHNAFVGKEDTMKRLVQLCRSNGITVTGYYSLNYNNWAHDTHPQWRMRQLDGKSRRESAVVAETECAKTGVFRYGLCCPNNLEYREFVKEQIKEMVEYFEFDGMFFDMPFWPHACYCDSCKERWAKEVGGELPTVEDYQDPRWLLFMEKRAQWMGEIAQLATDEVKRLVPHVSVEHNVAQIGTAGKTGCEEAVLAASDYAGGDLYGGIYQQSFVCKLYRNATKHQPFEYMLTRCTPRLSKHTVTKSEDFLRSEVCLTAAHHGATLLIDAIDPVGTLDSRVYERFGRIFEEKASYEKYFKGDLTEDIGLYFSMRSKFNAHGEPYRNHSSCVNTTITMIMNHICAGVTGTFHDLKKYPVLLAPMLTVADSTDYDRIIEYVRDGGQLYLSGSDCEGLLKEFFGAQVEGRTQERVVYVAPNEKAGDCFGFCNAKYPLHFDGTAPILSGVDEEKVIATVTLPYTHQDTVKFAAIHSDPPGVPTKIPAVAVTKYGKGTVLWSGMAIEGEKIYEYRRILLNLLRKFFRMETSVKTNAPRDVEITLFREKDSMYVNAVLLNEEEEARRVEPFTVAVRCEKAPQKLLLLPQEQEIPFRFRDGMAEFDVPSLGIFKMYQLVF